MRIRLYYLGAWQVMLPRAFVLYVHWGLGALILDTMDFDKALEQSEQAYEDSECAGPMGKVDN
jgi:hypothetical protein